MTVLSSPSPGTHRTIALEHYLIRRKLGSGSLGAVYLAFDERRGREVALKFIRRDRLSGAAIARLKAEFQALASVRHPRVAAALDFGYTGEGAPFYTREYIEGDPLPPGPPATMRPREWLAPLRDLLEALACLHGHGILHLDIHPGNLIVAAGPQRGSVLIDFGLIRPLEGPQLSEALPALSGHPPELIRGETPTTAADLFLAGRLLLYRLTGELSAHARLPREIPGWGPRRTLELERIASKALQPDPSRRFRTAEEFRDALDAALGEKGAIASRPEPGAVMVGRAAEVRRVMKVLRKAAAGRPASLWIAGPPGRGKSRLLEEVRLQAQLLGFEVAEVHFFPEEGPQPALIRALEAGGSRRRSRARWLEPLAAVHGGTPEERARRSANSYFEEEGRPLALLLDDLDRADRQSRTLLLALLAEAKERNRLGLAARGLAVVATAADAPRKWPEMEVFRLRPLPLAESKELLRALLQPLRAPEALVRRAAGWARGSPLSLGQVARVLAAAAGAARTVPDRPDLLPALLRTVKGLRTSLAGLESLDRELLAVLAAARGPASAEELAAALSPGTGPALERLARLRRADLVSARRGGRLYQLSRPGVGEDLLRRLPAGKRRAIHRRLAARLEAQPALDLRGREALALHLILSGRRKAGRELALTVAEELRGESLFERAVKLLGEAVRSEKDPRTRFRFCERMSSLLEEAGDHREGLALLLPFYRLRRRGLSSRDGLRLLRRLGIHYHRSGQAAEAARIFEEAQALADPVRDLEDLVFIDSELAEIHNLHGRYAQAEEACRRGLRRLSGLPDDEYRARMEVVLLATRGHLELRRVNLEEARKDLDGALRLASRLRMRGLEAVILNNLGIALSQLNQFSRAETCFHRARRLLLAAGERRALVAGACNLALVAAKRGDRQRSLAELDRASQLLVRFPGDRLEFVAGYTRGAVASLLGDAAEVLNGLPPVLLLGRKVGDLHLVRSGEIHLAEALLVCGRYQESRRRLREAAEGGESTPVLERMVQSRLLALAALTGQAGLARRAREALEACPRSGVVFLEAWNDVWLAVASLIAGERVDQALQEVRQVFSRLGVLHGRRAAELCLLLDAILAKDRSAVDLLLREGEAMPPSDHRLLAVAEPLARAEACLFLGDFDRARERLSEASAAIVGSPFLELDWWIELLRARTALKEGDAAAARGYLHRCRHTRDLLLQGLPAGARRSLLAHPRFRELDRLSERLERSPRLLRTSRPGGVSGSFEGMVGRSEGMQQVFRTIERLRDQQVPVLISGETGTGKELVARALHRTSVRGRGAFFALHCASLPVELFESELFGCEAGAFTGAEEARAGILESLRGGTVLLDGVGELGTGAQAKLLRVLDSGTARRVGGTAELPLDVRFLASASSDLRKLIAEGRFRSDLYYRLGGVEIVLPPLRERREDLAPLARHFLESHARRLERPTPALRPPALPLLEGHRWPGNVRELETVLLRALLSLSYPRALEAEDLRPFLASGPEPTAGGEPFDRDELLEGRSLEDLRRDLERAYLRRLFRKVRGDLGKMRDVLKVKRSYLYTWLRRVGLDIRSLKKRL